MNWSGAWRRHPIVLEVNTRVWLAELSRLRGRRIHLGNVPDDEIERLQVFGLDGMWLMGVWAPSPASRRIALRHSGLGSELRRALPDLRDEDVIGSPYAIRGYQVSELLGGDEELRRFRQQLSRRSMHLLLDFVPNHLAVDHPWTAAHPEFLVQCGERERVYAEETAGPAGDDGCFALESDGRQIRFAHGRDPYFPPWTDTVQVDYNSTGARAAMVNTLQTIADHCDGVRCDMAMLVTNDVFRRVWGLGRRRADLPTGEFWEEAISAVKARYPGFVFLAEVYWEMDRELQRQGFTFTYDKGLYDRLVSGDAGGISAHLRRDAGFQDRVARFIENHDERRAADVFGRKQSAAAAVLVATLPGLRLFHQGQFEGRRVRLPVQLGRRPSEAPDLELEHFYQRLLSIASQGLFHDGEWRLLEPRGAWSGNGSYRSITAYTWHLPGGQRTLIVLNLGQHRAQAVIPLSWPGLCDSAWRLSELLDEDQAHPTIYRREGSALQSDGMFVELEPSSFHFLSLEPVESSG